MDNELTSRRELMEGAARALAAAGGVAFFSSWLKAAQAPLKNYQPAFFSTEEFAGLQAFTETLIPTDDTPGAREAHCAHYIDFLLQASDEPVQKRWRDALAAIKAEGFFTADAKERDKIMSEMARGEIDPAARKQAYPAYRLIKQQTTFAFYTSRQGMIGALDYKGNTYHMTFPACEHPEHRTV